MNIDFEIILTFLILLLIYGCIGLYHELKYQDQKDEIKRLLVVESLHKTQLTEKQQVLMDQIRKHIRSREQVLACQELRASYAKEVASLQKKYSRLTSNDIDILLLLGIGLSNQEVVAFMDMNKRSYYRRRQLISERTDIPAANINSFACQWLGEKNDLSKN